jgi:hypothetical protein
MDAATSVPKVPRKKPDAVDLAERTLRDFLAEMDGDVILAKPQQGEVGYASVA